MTSPEIRREAIQRMRQAHRYEPPSSLSVALGCAAHFAAALILSLVVWGLFIGWLIGWTAP